MAWLGVWAGSDDYFYRPGISKYKVFLLVFHRKFEKIFIDSSAEVFFFISHFISKLTYANNNAG